jgi:hypothetical protein
MANVTLPATGSTGSASPVIEAATGPSSAARQVVTIGDKAGNAVDSIGGLTETAPASDTASSGLNGRLQRIAQRFTSLIALVPAALSPAGALKTGLVTVNPTSVLTRPANTTAYAVDDLVANNVTAGSVTVPSFTATPTALGSGHLRRARLITNKTSGMDASQFLIEFWQAAPTVTNGDNGAYAIATGAANWLGQIPVTLTQVADGAYGAGAPMIGNAIDFRLASSTLIYWTLRAVTAFTPASAQTFTLIPEIVQD